MAKQPKKKTAVTKVEAKPLGYGLFIDEDKSYGLTILMNMARLYMESDDFKEDLGNGELDTDDLTKLRDFTLEISKNTHKMGWCLDPHCEFPQGGVSPGESKERIHP